MNKTVLFVLVAGFFGGLTLHTGCIGSSGGGSDDDDGNGGTGACVPDIDEQPDDVEADPECEQCFRANCKLSNEDCSDPCEEYYACTCDCDGDDDDCFSDCRDDKSSSCSSCEEDAADGVLSCIEDECSDECLDGESIGDSGEDDDEDEDDEDDAGADTGGEWTTGYDDTGYDDTGYDDTGYDDTGGGDTGGGGAVCEELHECCAGLDAADQQLCDLATDEFSCELWLEIFQDEGKC